MRKWKVRYFAQSNPASFHPQNHYLKVTSEANPKLPNPLCPVISLCVNTEI